MKKAVLLLAGIFFTLAATAQQKKEITIGNGIITRDVREITDFEKLEVNGPFDVRLVPGEGSVVIEGEKNLTGLITTEVKGNLLTIAPQENRLFKSSTGNKIIIKVPMASVNEVALKGSGSISSRKEIAHDIKLMVEGSGKIDLAIASRAITAIVAGSGSINLHGDTEIFNANVTGAGSIKADKLAYNSGNVHVTGSGFAIVKNKEIIKSSNGLVSIASTSVPKN